MWPRDPVRIQVRLASTTGQALPFSPTLKVTVNLDPIPVEWHRDGDVYRAVVPPVTKPGPWVVRTEITDPHGNEIGRGFLEVARVEDR